MHNHKKEHRCFLKLIWVAVVLTSFTYATVGFTTQTIKTYIPNEWPDSRYIDYDADGDSTGVVVDKKTRLMWTKCLIGQVVRDDVSREECSGTPTEMDWKAAVEITNERHHGYYWRLPSRQELITLMAFDRNNPAINENIFPNAKKYIFVWSSTPYAEHVGEAFSFNFREGGGGVRSTRDTNNFYVRLVRDIPYNEFPGRGFLLHIPPGSRALRFREICGAASCEDE